MTLWEIIFTLIILKIPVAYVGWVVWWAIKAEPEIDAEGGTEGVNWAPWRHPSPAKPPVRPRRGGPHGAPARSQSRSSRKHDRAVGPSA